MLVGLADLEPLFTVGLTLGAALLGTSWIAKRMRAGAGARQSVALTGQHAVHVVELEGERLVIGTGPSGAPRLIARLPALEVPPTPAAPPSNWLDRWIAQWGTMRG
ncbi:hypothetical protein ACNOYE_01580 [Nannocystaceae bacterium ST9]